MNKLIIISGPTCTGKSSLSIKFAKQIGGEVISADSIQVYKGLDIGSAKITTKEMQGVKHHLIDVLEPNEDFNVYIFKEMANAALEEIYANDHIPIIVGGTGFYIQSILYDIDFCKEDNSKVRYELEQELKEKGSVFLYNILKEIDPKSCEKIHPNNTKRVIRAIEYYRLNNKPISEHNEEERLKKSVFDANYFVLTDERDKLYERINNRVDTMLEQGLVNEVKGLLDAGLDVNSNSMQGIGYKEIVEHLTLDVPLEEAIDTIKKNTRHFAKRQLTWFRRERDVNWIDISKYDYDNERILSYMIEVIKDE